MKIVIDVSSAVYGTGVSVYAKELIRAIAKLGAKHQYVLLAGTLRKSEWYKNWFSEMDLPDNFCLKLIPISPRAQLILWNDLKMTKLEWFVGDFDLYHSLDWSLAPTNRPTIMTVHDLFFIKSPETQQHPFAKSLERRLVSARNRKIEVIAVSKSTKNDLISVVNYPESLINVIYEACPQNWKQVKNEPEYNKIRTRLGLPEDYILSVSTQEPRKNMTRLVNVYGKLKSKIPLVIVGKSGWGNQTKPMDNIISTGYLSDEVLMVLWSYAKGFVYPSLYEGFGLPILQSFVSQVPVLTSNISSMAEIAGNAAIFINPDSQESIEEGLKLLLNLSQKNTTELVSKGLMQVKKFNWDSTASATVSLYEKYA